MFTKKEKAYIKSSIPSKKVSNKLLNIISSFDGNLEGPQGEKGDTGTTGSQGEKGDQGDSAAILVGSDKTFTTIQAALDFIQDASSAPEVAISKSVFIDGGIYPEDLVIPKGRIINLISMGLVILGNGLGSNGASTDSRSITASYSSSDVFGVSIRPALSLMAISHNDATSTFINHSSGWKISGAINITGSGQTHSLNLHSCEVSGIINKTADGLTNFQAYRSCFKGAVNMGTSTALNRAIECQFDSLVTVESYGSLTGCEIKNGMTVTSLNNNLPPNGMFHTSFTGTFTGPVGSFKVDTTSDYMAIINGVTLAGGATKVLMSDTATQLSTKQNTLQIASVSGAHTLVIANAGKLLEINSVSDVDLTVPLNASVPFAIGTEILFSQVNTGKITVDPSLGVTLKGTKFTTTEQDVVCGLIKIDTDTWRVIGSLTA